MKLPGKQFLTMLGVIIVALLAVVYHTGVRFPPPQLIPEPAPTHSGGDSIRADEKQTLVRADGAIFQQRKGTVFQFRAFVPEPKLQVDVNASEQWIVEVQNVHPGAKLVATEALDEERENLVRRVSGKGGESRSLQLKWEFPKKESYRFAAIGDTGGGSELEWVLKRSKELGADFLLHLGDFNYDNEDYESAIEIFNAAAIPSYVAIGNHDFYVGLQTVHWKFTRYIGPKNASFNLGRVQFVNIDTAATFVPKDAGARGGFLSKLEPNPSALDFVVFTHKSFADPREEKEGTSHRVDTREGDWLRQELLKRGMKTLLAGHIHIKSEFNDRGLRTYISGQGLAHADYIFGHQVAEILIGDISPDQPVSYRWEPLNMPFAAHCSQRGWEVLDALEKDTEKSKLQKICTQ